MNLSCRLCRVSMAAANGCDVCNPMRALLVATNEDEGERPALGAVAAETVALLRDQLADAKTQLAKNRSSLMHETRALKLGNTLAKVLETARKLQQDGVDAVTNMPFADKADLFISWYIELPPAYRASLRERFAQYEVDVSRPVADKTEELTS